MKTKALYNWFNAFNVTFFKGDLPFTTIETDLKNPDYRGDFLGIRWDEGDELRIRINLKQPDNATEFNVLETLLHEMFHVYQFVNKRPINHGKAFRKFARKVEKEYGMMVI